METNFIEHSLEAIDSLLKLGGSFSIPYKKKLLEWYPNGGLCLLYMDDKYIISCHGYGINEEYDDLAMALKRFEHFIHPKNNIGVALQMVLKDHKIDDELDHPPVTRKVRSLLKRKEYQW
jgi:hypothetical protein